MIVGPELDGVLTTDRFIILRPLIDPALARLILNSAGVRRQIVAHCRGAASLDIRERTLASVMVPCGLLEKPHSQELIARARAIEQMRTDLAERTAALREKIEQEFGSDEDFRPAASLTLEAL